MPLSRPLVSAAAVWRALEQQAGLDVGRYDQPLLKELASSLGLNADNFVPELDRAGIGIEQLLLQFLRLISPYAQMMQDILRFFSSVDASTSKDAIRMRFEFEKADAFEIDLSTFRDWERQLREGLVRIRQDQIDPLRLLQIRGAFVEQGTTYRVEASGLREILPNDTEVVQWLESGLALGDITSNQAPGPPPVELVELRSFLTRVWSALELMSQEDKRTVVRGAWLMRHREDLLVDRLRVIYADMPSQDVIAKGLYEQLLEVLRLPVWDRRSEVYSVWVGVRLIEAFGPDATVHVIDRSLVFAFGGSHLATVNIARSGNLLIWCEYRTPARGLLGRSRKNAIQPDYVVLREPISSKATAVLVVECKQYLKQKPREFANALIDYARHHENASIVLASYGPATDAAQLLVSRADDALSRRTHVVSGLRPGSAEAIAEFERIVGSLRPRPEIHHQPILQPPPVPAHVPVPRGAETSGAITGHAVLSWNSPFDYDLHGWASGCEEDHIYYGCLSTSGPFAMVALDTDKTSAGAETMSWRLKNSSLTVAVHAYTDGTEISQGQPSVALRSGDIHLILRPPPGSKGRWWHVFTISSGVITVHNLVGSEQPGHRDGP